MSMGRPNSKHLGWCLKQKLGRERQSGYGTRLSDFLEAILAKRQETQEWKAVFHSTGPTL